MNKIIALFRNKEFYLFIVRYALGMEMMGYGMLKIIGLQTQVFQPVSVWRYPLEEVRGTYLTWAFLGYSHWFVVVLGLLEFIPAALLVFRRTALLGATLLFPMTLSVCLINYSLELWTITQRLSVALVILNILVFIFEWERVLRIATILLDKTRRLQIPKVEALSGLLAITAVIVMTTFPPHPTYDLSEKNVLIGDWTHKHQNEWQLVSETVNDSTVRHGMAKLYFGPRGIYCEINDLSINKEDFVKYSLNEKTHILTIDTGGYRGSHPNPMRHYLFKGIYYFEVTGDSLLTLGKNTDDHCVHRWMFRRRVMNVRTPE